MVPLSPNGARWPEPQPLANPGRFSVRGDDGSGVGVDADITIESMISICRTHASNVKRWRHRQMALRWCAAGMVEAGKQFRRVNGHLHLRALRDTLNKVTEPVGASSHDETVNAANAA